MIFQPQHKQNTLQIKISKNAIIKQDVRKKIFFKSTFKEGRDLGMLMISANWSGLE